MQILFKSAYLNFKIFLYPKVFCVSDLKMPHQRSYIPIVPHQGSAAGSNKKKKKMKKIEISKAVIKDR